MRNVLWQCRLFDTIIIESWGTGIGKAKRSLLDNGSPELHFEEFPEDVDITSVSIPISKEYLALERELYIGDEKMNIGAENMNINVQLTRLKEEPLRPFIRYC